MTRLVSTQVLFVSITLKARLANKGSFMFVACHVNFKIGLVHENLIATSYGAFERFCAKMSVHVSF